MTFVTKRWSRENERKNDVMYCVSRVVRVAVGIGSKCTMKNWPSSYSCIHYVWPLSLNLQSFSHASSFCNSRSPSPYTFIPSKTNIVKGQHISASCSSLLSLCAFLLFPSSPFQSPNLKKNKKRVWKIKRLPLCCMPSSHRLSNTG